MPCTESCKHPAPAQAHCPVCHLTFNSIRPFDAHRVNGRCAVPESLGMAVNVRGVYSWPVTEEERVRLASLSVDIRTESGRLISMMMSEAATEALINAGTNRQGAKVQGPPEALAELTVLGLIGSDNGLTRKGSIVREQTVAEALDRAFG